MQLHESPVVEFDFEAYEADYQIRLVENKNIHKVKGDQSKVYSKKPYAQDLYNSYVGQMPTNFANPIIGNVVQGTVISITKNFASVDINWRENAIIDLKKEKSQYLQYIMPGYPIEVQIERIETSSNGTSKGIYASYSNLITSKFKNELIDAVEKNMAYLGKVVELVHAGYFVDIKGVKCFMPGSLGGMNKLVDFSVLLNKDIYVVPVNYSKEKDYVVVSHRDYLKALVPGKVNELVVGQEYEGLVTGSNAHGIFVEFNECLTGLISRLDMSQDYITLYENNSIKPGDSVKFKLKKIISNEKLSLTQNEVETEYSKWNAAKNKYKVNSYAIGTIKRILPYGAFIELEEGIVGLLHKSNIKDSSELESSQELKVKIVSFDADNKKIILDV